MTAPAISVKDLFFSYDNTAVLGGVNLEIAEKEFLALIGPNGGGKTTFLKLLTGLLKPGKGQIEICGSNPQQMYSQIGYVPQNTNLHSDFPITAIEVVLMGHECEERPFFGYGKHEIACAEGALAQVDMLEFKDRKIGDLSGGQRQRVLIARAICAHHTKVLFLDEPTSSLDATGQQQIYELLKRLSSTMTVIVVSHDLEVILGYATKIGHINGKLTLHNAPDITRESIMSKLGLENGHLCEVDILNSLGKKHD